MAQTNYGTFACDLDKGIELLIDRHGINHILASMVRIASAKEKHVRANWQDKKLANAWGRVAKRLDQAENEALTIA